MFRNFAAAAAAGILLSATACSAYAADVPVIETFGNLPGAEFPRLSPSGGRVALIATVGEERHLLVTEIGGKVILNSRIGFNKIRDVEWIGDDRLFVTTTQTVSGGEETAGNRYELSVKLNIDLKTLKSQWVLSRGSKTTALMDYFGARQDGGRWYGYFEAYESLYDPPKLYRVDLETGAYKILLEGTGADTEWLVSPDGKLVARSEYKTETGEWRLKHYRTGEVLVSRKSPLRTISLDGFGRTVDKALLSETTNAGDVVEEVSLDDGKIERLAADKQVTGYFRDTKGLLIGLRTEEEPGAYFFDPVLQARYVAARKPLKAYQVSLASWTDDLNKQLLFTQGGDDPGTYWMVDIKTHAASVLAQAYGSLGADQVGPTSVVGYKASDGLAMDGVLTLPPGRDAKNLPVVIMPHGGPITSRDRVGFDWWAQAFASQGYAVFQPNYRGTQGYGEAFEHAAYGEWGAKMQSDLSDGLAALAAKGVVDPKRACIVGASYGGYAALAGVTLQHGVYRCAVSVAGVSDLKGMLHWESDRQGYVSETLRYWRTVMGASSSSDPILRTRSPAKHAAEADAPILLIHGKDDTVVPMQQSEEMLRELTQAKKPVEMVTLKSEDHWLSRAESRTAMLKAAIAFVEKHNPPG